MKCTEPCSSTYVGETKRILKQRIYEHGTSDKSAIKQHIDKCPHFKQNLELTYGVQPMPKEKLNFLEKLFKPVFTNSNNYFKRKRLEAIFITVTKPDLNNQIKHKKTHLIKPL